MQTIKATDYVNNSAEHGPRGKFPHTGPVYWEVGARPYSAVLKGEALRRIDGKAREFKTAEAACAAILKVAS